MRISTSGAVPRVDCAPPLELWQAVLTEWSELEFDDAGHVTDPSTGRTSARVTLTDGRHRAPGARYRLRTDDDRSDGTVMVLRGDTPDRLEATVGDEDDGWSAMFRLEKRQWPAATITAADDAVRLLSATDGGIGWLVKRYGGHATLTVQFDTAALAASAGPATGDGQIRAATAKAQADVAVTPQEWRVDARVDLSPRGLVPRLALLLFGRRLRAEADKQLKEFWDGVPAQAEAARTQIEELRSGFAAAGDARTWLHAALWAPDGPLLGVAGPPGAR